MLKKIAIFSLLLFYGCKEEKKVWVPNHNRKEDFKKSLYFKLDRVINDKYKVKYNGDKFAYSELELYYMYNQSRMEELIPYSLIMVEKHKKYNYCTNVYENLIQFYTGVEFGMIYDGTDQSLVPYLKKIELIDNQGVKDYCVYFIKLGTSNNDKSSINYLEKMYRNGIGVEKNIKKADSLHNVFIDLNKNDNFFKGD